MAFSKETFNYLGSISDKAVAVANALGLRDVTAQGILGAIGEEYEATGPADELQGDIISLLDHVTILENFNEVEANPQILKDVVSASLIGKLVIKAQNVVLNDVGPGNIKIHTAIKLLSSYVNDFVGDPLQLKSYASDYGRLVRDLANKNSDVSLKFSGLMLKEGSEFYRDKTALAWSTYGQDTKDAILITYYNNGRANSAEKIDTFLEGFPQYFPGSGGGDSGGLVYLDNVIKIKQILGIVSPSPDGARDFFKLSYDSTLQSILSGDHQIRDLYSQGRIGQGLYNDFTKWASGTLLNNFNNSQTSGSSSFNFGLNVEGLRYTPIGAFYETRTPAADAALSIASKTLVLLDGAQHSLTTPALGGLDADHDGKLSGSELGNISAWADLNENGLMDAGELQGLAQAGLTQINSTDYDFYTRGNSRVAATPVTAPVKPGESTGQPVRTDRTEAVPASNYRTLRDTDIFFELVNGGVIPWAPTQVKINYKNQTYLTGTDGNDAFDSNYYASYNYFNSSLLVNFLGGGGDDTVGGSVRDDRIWGGTGNDLLLGYAGNDKLYGEEGDDELQGHDGADYLDGGVGNDRLFGGAGSDVINGADGADALSGQGDDDSLCGGSGADTIVGGVGNDYLDGGDDGDLLLGEAGNDTLFGGNGVDELQGGDGNDVLLGEAGDDKLFGQTGNDILWGGAGNDQLMGFTASNEAKQTLFAGESDNDRLFAGAGNDNLYGGLGDDLLDGGDDNDVLVGNEGSDTLFGGAGNDEIQGNDGNDLLLGESGNDRLFGQTGNDTLWGGGGDDILVGFTAENEAKQSLAYGESDNDSLYGGVGNDLLLGGLGDDTVFGETGADELQGGSGADLLFGGEGDDKLFGQVGDDVLYGGEGNDILVGFTATNESKQSLAVGESDNDWLYGGAGNDTLLGGVGNDYLDGGAGADLMEGGTGDDIYIVNSVNDSILEHTGAGYDTVVSSSNYLLNANIEELRLVEGLDIHATGNAQDNKLIGNSRNNILDGVTGKDTMIGGLVTTLIMLTTWATRPSSGLAKGSTQCKAASAIRLPTTWKI
ncbi:calcium-binding protein [Pseudomonas cavernicola]|uniref:calcium-binding protein n=1 Tax=Pseudomonas cavernicola TaxID=2320866 RepID=UPI001C4993FB|nr:calcium-binding protein [Pseudomonas cavernicola]